MKALIKIIVVALLILIFGCADTRHMARYYDKMYQGYDTTIYPGPGGCYEIN